MEPMKVKLEKNDRGACERFGGFSFRKMRLKGEKK